MESLPTLSIIIPCFNEEEGIPALAQKVLPIIGKLNEKYKVELLLIDDGSTDKTNQLLQHYFNTEKNTRIITHDRNKNLGAALKTGFAAASGDFVAALDSDCTYDPQLLEAMLSLMDDHTDIVTVSPYHPQGKVNHVPRYRLFLSKSISSIYRQLLSVEIHTFTAMVRVYRKEVVKNIPFKSDTFLGVTELMIKALLQGCTVKELPAELNLRVFGTSKMKTMRVIRNHLGLINRIIWYKVAQKEL